MKLPSKCRTNSHQENFFPKSFTPSKGVVTGCDARQEWMLKWFWRHYRENNSFPITFFDFGMSNSAKKWCQKRGQLLSFSPFPLEKHTFSFPSAWSAAIIDYYVSQRSIWFTKAFSLAKTPYEKTLWVDMDCKVCGDISPLFSYCDHPSGFAITYDAPSTTKTWQDAGLLSKKARGYQAGVFSFHRNSPIFKKWLSYCKEENKKELSDQTSLDHLLEKDASEVAVFSEKYNYLHRKDLNPNNAIIIHYAGTYPKWRLLSKEINS